MALAVQGTTTTAYANANNVLITKPSGFASGEILFAQIFIVANTPVVTPPAGWVSIRQDQDTTANINCIATFYKVWAAGDASAADYTFSINSTTAIAGGLTRISGANTTSPVNASAADGTATGLGTTFANTITPNANSLLLFSIMWNPSQNTSVSSTFAIVTSNPTWTKAYQLDGSSFSNSTQGVLAYATRAAATATGNSSFAATNGGGAPYHNIGQMIAIDAQMTISATETLTVTDTTVGITIMIILREVVTILETTVNITKNIWNNAVKHVSSWLDQTKH